MNNIQLAPLDLAIIAGYLILTILIGFLVSKKASKDTRSYFLGGNKMPWYALGLSNASGQFDIGGTMWMVALLFVYGLKSIFIPWLWPVFNQIFMMVFLSAWLRRSGVMTGAEWITFRFGSNRGAELSHFIVIAFALLVVLGYLAFSFVGIGKFAAVFMPFTFSENLELNAQIYGLIIVFFTSIYVIKGGMYSVVVTELLQFAFMFFASIAIGVIAMKAVAPEQLAAIVPDGWMDVGISWKLDIDWSQQLAQANTLIETEGYSLFTIFIGLVFFQGVLKSMAGPAPNYDMQRVLSAKSPREASMMSGVVNVVLLWPRYMMITGLTILALVYFIPELRAAGPNVDFDTILPFAINNYLPVGLMGIVLAGLLAAFMSSFAATTNAAPAYVVNDIVKKYFKPNESRKYYVRLSVFVSALFVFIGTLMGLFIPSLNKIILWITAALYGGYAVSNVLKWYWWRFNGYGYFYGMVVGIISAVPFLFIDVSPLFAFPIVLVLCLIGCVAGSLLTKPDDMEVLKNFYIKTRPWGFWAPVLKAAQADDPSIGPNTDFYRDALNVCIGIVWQLGLMAAPIFLVIQDFKRFWIAFGFVVLATLVMKSTWYDKLKNEATDYNLA